MTDDPGAILSRYRLAMHLKALYAWHEAVEEELRQREEETIELCVSALRINRAIRQTRQQLADTYRHKEEMK